MKKSLLSLVFAVSAITLHANNIVVENVSITGQNVANHFSLVQFDVSWENSWRTSSNERNYDGAWVFIKFRKAGTYNWQHATLHSTGHTAAAGSTIEIPADGKGAFIHRSADGIGNVNYANTQLRWNYGADGVLDSDLVEVKVFAVEMVYIPQGTFYLGSGIDESYSFKKGDATDPYHVSSNDAIPIGNNTGQLSTFTQPFNAAPAISADYPKGYNAFWVMKYEISRQQYLDFLNSLSAEVANERNAIGATGVSPNMTTNKLTTAADYLSGNDLLTFLDWSALRPMSEMEFEKACRGANITPVPGEMAWGNTMSSVVLITTSSNVGMENETWESGNCHIYNFAYASTMRCGALATSTSTRASSGATYYGVMEMSGNVNELVVTADPPGRTLSQYIHGDGNIGANGLHNVITWDAANNIITRGGSYNTAIESGRVSSRANSIYFHVKTARAVTMGGRGVRSGS